jgi:hypothetical protein
MQSTDGRDLSVELDQACSFADGITDEHAAEAMRLSQHAVGISIALANLGMLHVQYISQLPKSTREVLSAADLILKRLQEALPSGVGPWE